MVFSIFKKSEPAKRVASAPRRAAISIPATVLNLGGQEVVVLLCDYNAVKTQELLEKTFATLSERLPGKNLVLAAKNELKLGQPAMFLGDPRIVLQFQGRNLNDFKWQEISLA